MSFGLASVSSTPDLSADWARFQPAVDRFFAQPTLDPAQAGAFTIIDSGPRLHLAGGPDLSAYYAQPFTPEAGLPANARYVLQNRQPVMDDGVTKVVLTSPEGYTAVANPRGGGFSLVPPGWQPGDGRANTIRFQPAGTGSASPQNPFSTNYPQGYYVVHNDAGQPISIYTGRPAGPEMTHNPYAVVVPPGLGSPRL